MTCALQDKYEREARRMWDVFYKVNTDKFFKARSTLPPFPYKSDPLLSPAPYEPDAHLSLSLSLSRHHPLPCRPRSRTRCVAFSTLVPAERGTSPPAPRPAGPLEPFSRCRLNHFRGSRAAAPLRRDAAVLRAAAGDRVARAPD